MTRSGVISCGSMLSVGRGVSETDEEPDEQNNDVI